MCSYEKASGQQLNRNKTDIFFSKSTPPNILDQIKDSLGVQEIKQYEKYLGLLSLMGKNKKASLLYIKERVLAKLQGWKEQLLSQTGCEVLLKVVIQAISTYAMSCFKLPITLCNDIEALIRKFQWGQRGNQKKIHQTKCGALYVSQKTQEVWVSKVFKNLMIPCQLNKFGNCWTTRPHYFIGSSKLNFSPRYPFLMLRKEMVCLPKRVS